MKFNRCIAIVAAVFLIAVSGLASADILPKPVPENQLFTMDSIIEAVGPVSEKTTVVWQVGDAGLDRLANPRVNAAGNIESGSIAYVTYSDSIVTNGGQISEVKSFSMDTTSKSEGLYNIETTKVLTYTSQNGSHLMGEESYVLDVAGNWRMGLDGIVCVFSRNTNNIIPAFCNKVTASSKLTQVTTAQVETIGALTAVSTDASTPAALKYEIAVAPDSNSASGYADGIVSTTFTVSVMEGRSDLNNGARLNDGTMVVCADDVITNALNCIPTANLVGWNTAQVIFTTDATAFNNGVVGDTITSSVGGAIWRLDATGWVAVNNAARDFEALGFDNLWFQGNGAGVTRLTQGLNNNLWSIELSGNAPSYSAFNELASRLTYVDSATVSGGISTFNKVFDYTSGVACQNC